MSESIQKQVEDAREKLSRLKTQRFEVTDSTVWDGTLATIDKVVWKSHTDYNGKNAAGRHAESICEGLSHSEADYGIAVYVRGDDGVIWTYDVGFVMVPQVAGIDNGNEFKPK